MNVKPVRLRLSRRHGFDLQAASLAANGLPAVNVARPGPWGNPFVVGRDGSRADCVRLFTMMFDGYICLTSKAGGTAQQAYLEMARAKAVETLRARNLACWCRLPAPGAPDLCHAAVLLGWANHDTAQARCDALEPILRAVFGPSTCEAIEA